MVGKIRERMSAGEEIPGAKRFLMLIDREGGTSLGITFFDSEDAIRAAEPIFEKMAEEIPEELRGRRISVETYEVAIDDIADGARAARVSSLEGSVGRDRQGHRVHHGTDHPGGRRHDRLARNSHPRRPADR